MSNPAYHSHRRQPSGPYHLDDGEDRTITISIDATRPIACAAIANDEHDMLAALVHRSDETLEQLLERLDRAVQSVLDDNIRTDEINTLASPRRG